MATRVTINQGALNQLLKSPNGSIGSRLFRAGVRVSNDAKRRAPVDTGRLRSSIQATQPQVTRDMLTVRIGTNVNYGIFVHEGRRAGQAMPPSSALAGWASSHGASGAEFQIARSIGRRGIPANPFLKDALDALRNL